MTPEQRLERQRFLDAVGQMNRETRETTLAQSDVEFRKTMYDIVLALRAEVDELRDELCDLSQMREEIQLLRWCVDNGVKG